MTAFWVSAIALLVAGAFFMENLDGTVVVTAMPQMGVSFGVHAVDLNAGISVYMLTLAMLIPASGWIADRFGARLVFAAAIWFGIRAGGVRGYLATFASPNPIMIPLNFVESLTRTFSLLVRLFGNVMSGVFVIGIVLSLAGLLVPIPLMALDLLTGAVQAYIFAVLAMVFIAGAINEEGQPAPDTSSQRTPP